MVFQQQSWESPAFSTYCILNRVRLGSRMTWTSEYIQPGTKTCRKSFSKYLVPHTMSPEVASNHDPAINLDITISSSYCHHIECHNPQHNMTRGLFYWKRILKYVINWEKQWMLKDGPSKKWVWCYYVIALSNHPIRTFKNQF